MISFNKPAKLELLKGHLNVQRLDKGLLKGFRFTFLFLTVGISSKLHCTFFKKTIWF